MNTPPTEPIEVPESKSEDATPSKEATVVVRPEAKPAPVPKSKAKPKATEDTPFELTKLYTHMPPEFSEALHEQLRARGLVNPADYFKPGAGDLYRAAILSVIKHDFLNAQSEAYAALHPDGAPKRGQRS